MCVSCVTVICAALRALCSLCRISFCACLADSHSTLQPSPLHPPPFDAPACPLLCAQASSGCYGNRLPFISRLFASSVYFGNTPLSLRHSVARFRTSHSLDNQAPSTLTTLHRSVSSVQTSLLRSISLAASNCSLHSSVCALCSAVLSAVRQARWVLRSVTSMHPSRMPGSPDAATISTNSADLPALHISLCLSAVPRATAHLLARIHSPHSLATQAQCTLASLHRFVTSHQHRLFACPAQPLRIADDKALTAPLACLCCLQ